MELKEHPLSSNDKNVNKYRRELRINIKIWIGFQTKLLQRREENENMKKKLTEVEHGYINFLLNLIDRYFDEQSRNAFEPVWMREMYHLDVDSLESVARNEWNSILKELVTELIAKQWHFTEDMSELQESERNSLPSPRERQIRLKKVSEAVGSLMDKSSFKLQTQDLDLR